MSVLHRKALPVLALLVLLVSYAGNSAYSQCSSCTYTVSTNSSNTYTVNAGQTLCINSGITYTGQINLNGGTVCNQGTVDVASINYNSGTVNNYGSFRVRSQLNVNNGNFYNYGTLRVEGALNINALSSLYNYSSGTLQVTGNLNNNYRFVNDGQASVGGNYQANSGAGTQNINRGKLTVTGGIELNSAFQNSGQVSAGGNFAVNNGGSLDNQFGAKIQVKGNYTNNSTSVNNGKIYVEGNLVNNGGSVFTNNEDVEILGNFTNNGTLNGDTNGCNIFTVGGSQVIQNGGASTNNVDFCAQSFPSGNYSTNYGFVGSGTTYCNCSRSGVSPLPITLTAFKATCEGGTVEVSWTTASEINNAFFTVSRSTDAANWEPVEVVAGAGNSNATLTYRITDSRPLEGVSYYRLQQTDYDGTAESFAPVSVSCQAAAGTATLSVYPNPTTDIVRVALTSSVNESEVPVVLSDMNGRAQSIRNFNINSGQNEWTLDCSTLKNGIYTISIQSKLTRTSPIKLVVNHD